MAAAGMTETARAEEVRFDSDGCAIAGTYLGVDAPVAAALIITGSGRIDRDSDARMIRTGVTRQVAEALAAVNVASLRYDKRGIGASAGDYYRAGMTENLADARAALHWLAARAAGLSLLVAGHSEGTLHVAELAATEPNVAAAILLSAPARPGEQIIDWQVAMLSGKLPVPVKLFMRLFRIDFVRSQRKRIEKLKASTSDVIRVGGAKANARWFRQFLSYDPATAYARVTVPVLAIIGGHDLQVPPSEVDAIGRLVKGPFDGHVVSDLSHLLRPDPDWVGPRGYRKAVRQPVSPDVLTMIKNWVTARFSAPQA
jgi:uncharacterized protein